jgi:hypothetical protein
MIHVISMGLNHSNIHLVGFDEDMFKGVFFYEVLLKLHDDVARQELQVEQEEMNKFHPNQFLIFLQEYQNKLITKEWEKINKDEEMEKKTMKSNAKYHRRQVEEEFKRKSKEVEAFRK